MAVTANKALREWSKSVEAGASGTRPENLSTDDNFADAAAQLWMLLANGPRDLKIAFRNLDDAQIVEAMEAYFDELESGHLVWAIGRDWAATALSIAGQLRALDRKLTQLRRFYVFGSGPDRFLSEKYQAFVIPLRNAKKLGPHPGPGAGFVKRALPNHAIIPKRIKDDFDVVVDFDNNLIASVGPERQINVGAGLFPGESVEGGNTPDGWRVTDLKNACPLPVLNKQVSEAFKQPLFAQVFPELMMPPERLVDLMDQLRAASEEGEMLLGPAIICAGSWHTEVDGKLRNTMSILDRSGRERLRYNKISSFVGGGVTEANIPDRVVRILVTPDAIVSFAICSDFCDVTDIDVPFLGLDIDLLLIASLGTTSALKGHEGNAYAMRADTGCNAFVVQQRETSLENGPNVGWVIPKASNNAGFQENSPFSIRTLKLRRSEEKFG